MKIDKEQAHIAYNDLKHIYWNTNTNERYTSVTTMLGKYKEQFVASPDKTKRTQAKLGLTHEEVIEYWNEINLTSRKRGDKIHKSIENDLLNRTNPRKPKSIKEYDNLTNVELYNYRKFVKDIDFHNKYDTLVPEVLLYDDELKLAGQSDLLGLNKDYFDIWDWKTNDKELKYEHLYGNFFSPLDMYPASSLWEYTFQLNIYAYMTEKIYNIPCNSMKIIHFRQGESKIINIQKINLTKLFESWKSSF